MKTLSLYSGAGGIDLGFKKNKFQTTLAIENWDKACETLKNNKICSKIICDDIRNINFGNLKKEYKFDIVVGGPPCPPCSWFCLQASSSSFRIH
jgi:DNA (cytosine-5)-methyltransferase 1